MKTSCQKINLNLIKPVDLMTNLGRHHENRLGKIQHLGNFTGKKPVSSTNKLQKKKKKRQKGIRKPIDFNKSLKRHCGDLIWIVIWRNSKKKTKEILGNLRLVGRFVYFLSIRYGSCF